MKWSELRPTPGRGVLCQARGQAGQAQVPPPHGIWGLRPSGDCDPFSQESPHHCLCCPSLAKAGRQTQQT